MTWGDFLQYFDMVDVTILTQGMGQLAYDAMEDMECCGGCCGPLCGCVLGCAGYWCLCRGCCKLYCDRKCTKVFALESVDAGQKLSASSSGSGSGKGSSGQKE